MNTKQFNYTWAKELTRYASKEDIHTANRYVTKCSTSLTIREMQMKTMRYHLRPIGKAVIKKARDNRSW